LSGPHLFDSAKIPAIVIASINLGDDMDDDTPVVEPMTDATTVAEAPLPAAKPAVKKKKRAAKKAAKAPSKKAKKAKKAGKKSAAKKSAKKAVKKAAKKAGKKIIQEGREKEEGQKVEALIEALPSTAEAFRRQPGGFLIFARKPPKPSRPPVDQKHRGGAGDHACDRDEIEPFAEQDIGHRGGHRRHQVEQARDRGRRRAPDQPVQ